MTLISMLLALIIERLAVRSDAWQARTYCQAYLRLTSGTRLSQLAEHAQGRYLWVILPGLLLALLIAMMDNRLFTLIVNTLVLLVGIGCWHYRQLYKQYLNAKARGDDDAAYLAMTKIRVDSRSQLADDGLLLVWLNFRYYAAVVFWFLLLGAFGVITYVLLRQLEENITPEQVVAEPEVTSDPLSESEVAAPVTEDISLTETFEERAATSANDHETAEPQHPLSNSPFSHLLHWADWFPARLFGLGFALVGHFSKATNALLGYFLDFTANNEQVIAEVARAAEPVLPELQNTQEDAANLVQLAKRNMLFFLAFTAVLTLTGWLS